jgi:hypothetical protein
MKRARKWSADNRAGEGHAGAPVGPLRRRRALRHLDSLALDPEREASPAAATAHVRVIGEPGNPLGGPNVVPRAPTGRVLKVENAPDPTEPGVAAEPVRRRVHAVPIDQPFDTASRSAAPEN